MLRTTKSQIFFKVVLMQSRKRTAYPRWATEIIRAGEGYLLARHRHIRDPHGVGTVQSESASSGRCFTQASISCCFAGFSRCCFLLFVEKKLDYYKG